MKALLNEVPGEERRKKEVEESFRILFSLKIEDVLVVRTTTTTTRIGVFSGQLIKEDKKKASGASSSSSFPKRILQVVRETPSLLPTPVYFLSRPQHDVLYICEEIQDVRERERERTRKTLSLSGV